MDRKISHLASALVGEVKHLAIALSAARALRKAGSSALLTASEAHARDQKLLLDAAEDVRLLQARLMEDAKASDAGKPAGHDHDLKLTIDAAESILLMQAKRARQARLDRVALRNRAIIELNRIRYAERARLAAEHAENEHVSVAEHEEKAVNLDERIRGHAIALVASRTLRMLDDSPDASATERERSQQLLRGASKDLSLMQARLTMEMRNDTKVDGGKALGAVTRKLAGAIIRMQVAKERVIKAQAVVLDVPPPPVASDAHGVADLLFDLADMKSKMNAMQKTVGKLKAMHSITLAGAALPKVMSRAARFDAFCTGSRTIDRELIAFVISIATSVKGSIIKRGELVYQLMCKRIFLDRMPLHLTQRGYEDLEVSLHCGLYCLRESKTNFMALFDMTDEEWEHELDIYRTIRANLVFGLYKCQDE